MYRWKRLASNLLVVGLAGGVPTMLTTPGVAWGSESDCRADLTCTRSAQAIVAVPRSRGPDLSTWRLASLVDPERLGGQTQPPRRVKDPTSGLEMALIPGACYQAADEEGPANAMPAPICLDPFFLGVHEVTFDAYDLFVREAQREPPEDEGWGRGNRPVINVNLYDALAFAKWLSRRSGASYRLPTETEWEHAARAGALTAYPWGEAIGTGLANCDGCGSAWDGEQTAPVGSFQPNPWGLYDMIGNVGEWTCSMRNPDPASSYSQCDSLYETRRRVYRNGGWSDRPERLAVAFRDWNAAFRRTDDVGFRLVRECPECVTLAPAEPTFADRTTAGGNIEGGVGR